LRVDREKLLTGQLILPASTGTNSGYGCACSYSSFGEVSVIMTFGEPSMLLSRLLGLFTLRWCGIKSFFEMFGNALSFETLYEGNEVAK
jgi:hypothetical protein